MALIFLVEDNAADVELFRMALDEAGLDYELKVFEDGLQISQYVLGSQAAQDQAVPDLIMLDLNLPKISGVEVLQTICQVPTFQRVPIAVISSSSSFRDRDKLTQCNILAYIVSRGIWTNI